MTLEYVSQWLNQSTDSSLPSPDLIGGIIRAIHHMDAPPARREPLRRGDGPPAQGMTLQR
jgi:hypothetical protein